MSLFRYLYIARMKLSDYTILALADALINSSGAGMPYLKGPEITALFNDFCVTKESYGKDWKKPDSNRNYARGEYAVKRLKELNETPSLTKLIERVVQKEYFIKHNAVFSQDVVDRINIILSNDEYKIEIQDGKCKVVGELLPDEIKVKAYFEDIQKQILEQIDAAKYLVWVAVAWFTDKSLMNALYKKQAEGVNVQIIIYDDEINRTSGILQPAFSNYFPLFRINEGQWSKMHNKFCIIDLKTVIQGSYNWTEAAKRNKETIQTTHGRQEAEAFADQFMELKRIALK